MKTPIQQLISTLNELSEPRVSDSLEQEEYKGGLRVAAAYAKQMLDKEEEVIVDAYRKGFWEAFSEHNGEQPYKFAEEYYNETFNTKEK